MNRISVFTDKTSNNDRIFNGKSATGNTFNENITKLDVKDRDQLISSALLLVPDDCYILIAYGPLSTTMSTKELYNGMEFLIEQTEFDLLYLTNYADVCKLRGDEYSFNFMTFSRSVSPHGTECILISPSGIKRMLELVRATDLRGYDYYLNASAEKMLLYVSTPPMMLVDDIQGSSQLRYIKGTICKEKISAEQPPELIKKYTGNMNLFWFFLIIIFILFIAAMLISFGGPNKIVPVVKPGDMVGALDGKQNIARSLSPWN